LSGAYRGVQRKVYIRAANYPSLPFDRCYERVKTEPSWTAHQVPCGHDVMVDMPDALAELLEAAV